MVLSTSVYTKSHNQVIGITLVLLPEAICCCLQTCKCGFDIRVVLCTSVPSLIVRNTNTTLALQTCKSCVLNALYKDS